MSPLQDRHRKGNSVQVDLILLGRICLKDAAYIKLPFMLYLDDNYYHFSDNIYVVGIH